MYASKISHTQISNASEILRADFENFTPILTCSSPQFLLESTKKSSFLRGYIPRSIEHFQDVCSIFHALSKSRIKALLSILSRTEIQPRGCSAPKGSSRSVYNGRIIWFHISLKTKILRSNVKSKLNRSLKKLFINQVDYFTSGFLGILSI